MITIALAGNPNSGKTTLLNALTGSNQYVGNWPGVTVERKEARFELEGEEATLVDLPGVYSLSPYSIEENITRHFIAQHSPDVVLNIVDATNLERNLYLTFQLLELSRPVVVALNLMDEVPNFWARLWYPFPPSAGWGLTRCSPPFTSRRKRPRFPGPWSATTRTPAWP